VGTYPTRTSLESETGRNQQRFYRKGAKSLLARFSNGLGNHLRGNMKIQEITESFGHLKIGEKRCIEDEYAEMVVFQEELDDWYQIFEGFLGLPEKPAGKRPSKNHEKVTDAFGGIQKGQTLFQRSFDNISVIAMFWPWQDQEHVTLKMAIIENIF
jgi:hypothetical protein